MGEAVSNKTVPGTLSLRRRFVVAWPGPLMSKVFYTNKSCIFYSEDGWLFLNEQGFRTCISMPKSVNPLNYVDPVKIRSRLYKWLPVIYRWTPIGSDVEQTLSRAILQISCLVNEIKMYNVHFVLYHTAVPHHYDSMKMSIACELADVTQIFLYPNVFDGGLLPVIQRGGIPDRKICSWKRGAKDYSMTLQSYVNKREKGETPSTSDPQTKRANWWKESMCIAVGYLILLRLRVIASRVRRIILGKNDNYLQLKDYSFVGHLFFLFSQFSYLRLYERSRLQRMPRFNLSDGKRQPIKVLIAAHYQPEATSFPEGWDYFDHLDIAIKIRSLGYADEIYYKEHYGTRFLIERFVGLTRVGLCRSRQYLKNLQDLGCVFLRSDHPIPLHNEEYRNVIPVTITGTIAIERSLLGLRTLVFGNPWYKGLPGTIHINDIPTLHDIPETWILPCESIAIEAKAFLESRLSFNTISNATGIGVGSPGADVASQELFKSECVDLVSRLMKTDSFLTF
ncbi:MAG: hypothetical protein FJ184_01180 [Gammaproteobacteria bacterium]|nr:hypothetical protein [Gammaproteobacteria bacterium]